MIEKRSKNSIQWLGAGPGCNTREVTDKLLALKEELVELENKEMELDQHFSWAKQSIFNITDDPANRSLSYIKHSDLCKAFPNETLLVIQGPPGTQLEVPKPVDGFDEVNGCRKRRLQIHLRSRSGPINVTYVNKDVDGEEYDQFYQNLRKTIEETQSDSEELHEIFDTPNDSSQSDQEESIESSDRTNNRRSGVKPLAKSPLPATVTVATNALLHNSNNNNINSSSQPAAVSLRQLSPRKAAQQHLFVQSKRASTATATANSKSPAQPSSCATGGQPSDKLVSTGKDHNIKLKDKKDESDTEVANIENKPINRNIVLNSRSKSRAWAIEGQIRPDILQPLLRLSPPPSARDYCFNLDPNEGAYDLFGPQPLIQSSK